MNAQDHWLILCALPSASLTSQRLMDHCRIDRREVVSSTIYKVPGVNMSNHEQFQIWPARYKAWNIEIHESQDHYHWISTSEIRKVLPSLRPDRYLLNAYATAIRKLDQGPRHFIGENALMRELRRMGGKDALIFLHWFDTSIIYPAIRKRGDLQGIQPILPRGMEPEKQEDLSKLHVVVPPIPALKRSRPMHLSPQPVDEAGYFQKNLLGLVIRHWRGKEGLAQSLFKSGIAMLMWLFSLLTIFNAVIDQSGYTGDYVWRQWAVLALIVFAGAGLVWWCVGVMRCALRYQRECNGFAIPMAVYVSATAFLLYTTGFALSISREWMVGWWETVRHKLTATEVLHDPLLRRIVVRGEIGFGSYLALQKALKMEPKLTLIQIESPGGYVVEGLAMAELIQRRHLDTVSLELCASACTLLLSAGTERYLGPQVRVGFHKSWTYKTLYSNTWSQADHKIADYYKSRSTSEAFIQQALATPGYRMWYPQHALMYDAGYATKRWDERGTKY